MAKEFNFVTERTTEADIELFLGGGEYYPDVLRFTMEKREGYDAITTVPNDCTKEDIAVDIGLFDSKTKARKNGWQGPIVGYSEYINKKKGVFVYMLDIDPNVIYED